MILRVANRHLSGVASILTPMLRTDPYLRGWWLVAGCLTESPVVFEEGPPSMTTLVGGATASAGASIEVENVSVLFSLGGGETKVIK